VTVLLDSDGLFGLDIAREVGDGKFWIMIGCADGQQESLRAFWEQLVDAPLGFGEVRVSCPDGRILLIRSRFTSTS
jgi:hypothetical protein